MHDVIVIGAGPGGLYAAHRLSSDGFDVVVLEEHQDIGNPVHCTGILAADAFDEFDLSRQSILNELRTARFYSPEGQSFQYTTRRAEAVVVDRRSFDHLMSLKAQAAGSSMVSGKRVTALQIDNRGVRVSFADGSAALTARACILACGANYTLQRMLGLGVPSIFLQSAQAELPALAGGDVEIHLGSKIASKGFAWAVPVRRGAENHVRIGLMCDSNADVHFKSFVESVSSRWGIATVAGLQPRRKILPLAPIDRTFAERLLVVGDAAGLVKATTGGGIYYSIVSAALAAEVLGKSLRSDTLQASTLAQYEKRWQKRLGFDLQAQLAFRSHGQNLTDDEIEKIFDLVQTDGIIPLVRKTASFNKHRRLIMSLFRHQEFRRIFLRNLAGPYL